MKKDVSDLETVGGQHSAGEEGQLGQCSDDKPWYHIADQAEHRPSVKRDSDEE